jgi:uncharacterized Zn-binding protein involved in type VI secretion
MAKPATRVGDKDIVHDCQTPFRAVGSPDVYVNGRSWSRQGDVNTVHFYTPLCTPSHSQPIATGSKTVFINGKGAGRIGDKVAGCTAVATGSKDVFAG